MLLAIDIGNTNINFGIFKGGKLAKKFSLPTNKYSFKVLRHKIGRFKVCDSVICSVVPVATGVLAKDLSRLIGKCPYIIGKNMMVPIKNLYRKPQQVGQDRLVNAYAAITLYGVPIIAVDYGTAVTFDVVSKNKEYLGGMILPGLKISLEALNLRTALLPRVKLKRPGDLIGQDTENSMLSGIVYGFAALTDDLLKRIKRKIGRSASVIGTGGDIGLLKGICKGIRYIDKNLTLKGLNLLYNKKLFLKETRKKRKDG